MSFFDFFRKKKRNLQEDIVIAAKWIVEAMNSSNYKLDYSIESLKEIDRFFDEQCVNGVPKLEGLLADGIGRKIFAIGSYVALTFSQISKSEISTDDKDPKGEVNFKVLIDGGIVIPVEKVMKRLKNGQEDSLFAYGKIILKKYI